MTYCYICLYSEIQASCDECEKMFCSIEHLKLHRVGEACMPADICDDPVYGRHLVANKGTIFPGLKVFHFH